ncbi:MAG: hypothetical protein HRU22_15080, partial [Gammaproteobacteria bacterium]|nr:hypothetical protein [Gammaproteobacteria bacterium]
MATIISLLRLSIVIGTLFTSCVYANHSQGNNADRINQFKFLSVESQVIFVEEMLYADLSKVPQLLQSIKDNPAIKIKDLAHRILLIEALLLISSTQLDDAHQVLL